LSNGKYQGRNDDLTNDAVNDKTFIIVVVVVVVIIVKKSLLQTVLLLSFLLLWFFCWKCQRAGSSRIGTVEFDS